MLPLSLFVVDESGEEDLKKEKNIRGQLSAHHDILHLTGFLLTCRLCGCSLSDEQSCRPSRQQVPPGSFADWHSGISAWQL